MPTSRTPSAADQPSADDSATTGGSSHAIELLKKDHRDARQLFTAFQKMADDEAPAEEREQLADRICDALTAHAAIEEEIFYPAVREMADDASDELDEAEVEHASVKDLIEQIQAMDPDDDLYNAKVKVLGEYVEHHAREEEGEMFPKARKSGLDMEELGLQMQTRKEELLALSPS